MINGYGDVSSGVKRLELKAKISPFGAKET
jgi:hypothetical protein